MIEQYGTGMPRIKRARDAAGVAFCYRQDVNPTVIRFERPGAQTSNAAAIGSTDGAPRFPRKTQRNREDRHAGCTRLGSRGEKELMEQTGVGKIKATETLKCLAEKGLLEWVGSNQYDPRRCYRASCRR